MPNLTREKEAALILAIDFIKIAIEEGDTDKALEIVDLADKIHKARSAEEFQEARQELEEV